MRRLSVLTAALACVAQAAYAAGVTDRNAPFTTVCIDDQVTGFDWHAGAWVPGTLYPNKYTLQKRDAKSAACAAVLSQVPAQDDVFGNLATGCYTITDFGNGPGPEIACSEQWDPADTGGETLALVSCASPDSLEWIVFDPTGNFEYAHLGSDLASQPREDTKEPLIMSVGKCKFGRPPGLYPPGSAG
jgi:hypothetical protein